jgi:hypothetical protein
MRLNGWQRIGIVACLAYVGGWFMASPVLAEEVLHCVDTQVVGFVWDKPPGTRTTRGTWRRQARPGPARRRERAEAVREGEPERYTIKIVSGAERIITRTVGDTAGSSHVYKCKQSSPLTSPEDLACDEGTGMAPWVFHRNTYTRAFLYGPPAGGGDPNIYIAYGTCTKF